MAKSNHKHRMTFSGHGGKPLELHFRCQCGERTNRLATKEETKIMNKQTKDMFANAKSIHVLWYSFCKKFMVRDKFKYSGYDLMTRIEKWAIKNPTVQICSCDDDYHAGSRLFFIPHETDTAFMGTTIIFVSQFSPPCRFFFYRYSVESTINILKSILKNTIAKEKLEATKEKKNFTPTWKPKI